MEIIMTHIRVACQTYTWEMLGPAWRGQVTDLLDWVAQAGYEGIEITNTMIGEFAARPVAFAQALQERHLQLAAFAYATTGFTDPARWEEDLAGARRALDFLRHFPKTCLGLGGAASPQPDPERRRLDQAIAFYNEVGRLGLAAGVPVNVHPHSHYGSLLESAADYTYLMQRLDSQALSLGPDTGHVVRGGQDLNTCLRTWMPRITHLHLKDVTAQGAWTTLGQGACDFPTVFRLLEEAHYMGWVVAEEESEVARQDGLAAVHANRAYLRTLGY